MLAGGLLGGARALAHAQLLEITPGNDELVDEPPSEVVLRFSEPVSLTGGSARVLDDAAEVVSLEPVLEDNTITVPLVSGLDDGTYTITYEVVSADSHRISGASVFHVGVRTASAVTAAVPPANDVAWGVRLGSTLFSTIAYAGALVAGGVVALSVFGDGSRPVVRRPGRSDRLTAKWDAAIVRAAVLGAVAMLAATPFRIARVGGGLDALRDNELLRSALGGPIGQSMAVVVLALFAVAVAVDQRTPGVVVVAFVVAAIAGFTLEGHTRAERRWAMTSFDVVHLGAGALWLGGLVAVVVAYRTEVERGRLALLVRRFSTSALVAVVAVAGTGAAMAWVILPDWGALVDTGWGLALIVKVAVVSVVVAIGAYNNRRLVSRVDGDPTTPTERRLARTTTIETVLLLGVVAIASVLVTRSPIESYAAPSAGDSGTTDATGPTDPAVSTLVAVALSDGGSAEMTVSPAAVGRNYIEVVMRDDEGRIVNPIDAPDIAFTQPSLDVGPLEPEMTPRYIGVYDAAVDLSFPGDWDVVVRVRVSDFESVSGTATLTIAGD